MEDIDPVVLQQPAQGEDPGQGGGAFFAQRHRNMAAAFGLQLGDQAAAPGNHQGLVAQVDQGAGQVQNVALHPAAFQFGQHLDDYQPSFSLAGGGAYNLSGHHLLKISRAQRSASLNTNAPLGQGVPVSQSSR